MKTQIFTLKTERQGYYDITRTVREAVRASGVQSGIAVVFCPHTTGAITINENADPDVKHDLTLGLDAAFPDRAAFPARRGELGRAFEMLDRRRERDHPHRGRDAAARYLAGRLLL